MRLWLLAIGAPIVGGIGADMLDSLGLVDGWDTVGAYVYLIIAAFFGFGTLALVEARPMATWLQLSRWVLLILFGLMSAVGGASLWFEAIVFPGERETALSLFVWLGLGLVMMLAGLRAFESVRQGFRTTRPPLL